MNLVCNLCAIGLERCYNGLMELNTTGKVHLMVDRSRVRCGAKVGLDMRTITTDPTKVDCPNCSDFRMNTAKETEMMDRTNRQDLPHYGRQLEARIVRRDAQVAQQRLDALLSAAVFCEEEVGGAFDGFSVTSDADSGL